MHDRAQDGQVSDDILTLPNVVTFIRLMMVPLFLWLTFGAQQQTAGLVVYAVAASTDWIDGQLARRTGRVSKLGKILDPAVDRLLLASGVVAVCLLGRLPVWIVVVLILRDLILLAQGRYMLATDGKVPSVVYVGKFATAFLMFGYSFLLLGMPVVSGLHILDAAWLPGFGSEPAQLGIFLVYIGTVLSLIAFIIYELKGTAMHRVWKQQQAATRNKSQ